MREGTLTGLQTIVNDCKRENFYLQLWDKSIESCPNIKKVYYSVVVNYRIWCFAAYNNIIWHYNPVIISG